MYIYSGRNISIFIATTIVMLWLICISDISSKNCASFKNFIRYNNIIKYKIICLHEHRGVKEFFKMTFLWYVIKGKNINGRYLVPQCPVLRNTLHLNC